MSGVTKHSRFGGLGWRVTPAGVETDADGLLRTRGAPVTMRRLLVAWRARLGAVSEATGAPLAILMMTVATEGALRWTGSDFAYPPLRKEPGYGSDDTTPGRISFGPMHVLLATYRLVMRDPAATREQAMHLPNNLLAGARFMADRAAAHSWDPILAAASYNAGGIYPALPGTRFHNRWHIRAWEGHLDRAARWYGDACAVIAETRVAIPTPLPGVTLPPELG